MTTDYVLREAQPRDVEPLLSLMRELADHEHLTDLMQATAEGTSQALFGRVPSVHCLVAERGDGTLAAYAFWFYNYSTFLGKHGLYLEDVYVQPAARRQGLGRTMLRHLAGIARARDCGRFEWTVLDWNQSAIDFYESLGAEVLPQWRIVRVTGAALERMAHG